MGKLIVNGSGRGLRATERIEKDALIVSVPQSIFITGVVALGHPQIGALLTEEKAEGVLDDDDVLCILFIYLKCPSCTGLTVPGFIGPRPL